MENWQLMYIPGLSFEDNMIAFAFNNLASRERTERQDLAHHFEELFFPTLMERSFMWPQGNHLHAYAYQTVLFRENVSLMMIRIKLNLVFDVIMYRPNQIPITLLEHTLRCKLLCYFILRSIHTHVTFFRGIFAQEYRREMRGRLRNWVECFQVWE